MFGEEGAASPKTQRLERTRELDGWKGMGREKVGGN